MIMLRTFLCSQLDIFSFSDFLFAQVHICYPYIVAHRVLGRSILHGGLVGYYLHSILGIFYETIDSKRIIDLKTNRSSTALGLELSQSLLVQVSPLFSISKVCLGLSELGKVHGSNFLSLLNPLLVRLDLGLKLINQTLHALMVLAVLISRVSQLLDSALRLAQVLLGIREATVLSIKFRFQLPNASFHLVHCLLASLQSIGLSFIQALLHVLNLALQQLTVLLKGLSQILLSTEFISDASSINHCLLCLLIRDVGFTTHLIQIAMQGLHLRFQLPLSSSNGLVLASQV